MKIKSKIVLAALLGAGLAVGFGFPSVLGGIQDFQIARQKEFLDADSVRLTMKSTLKTEEKLQLVNRYSSSVVLDSAQNLTYEEAKEKIFVILKQFEDDFFIFFDTESCTVEKHTIFLRMKEVSSESLILWDFVLKDKEGNQIEAMLDDDSGLIMAIDYVPEITDEMRKLIDSLESYDSSSYMMEPSTTMRSEYFITQYLKCSISDIYMTDFNGEKTSYSIVMGDGSELTLTFSEACGFSFNT